MPGWRSTLPRPVELPSGNGELRLARRSPSSLTLVMLDIDRCKAVTDRYGHPEILCWSIS
jgi:hypothetical protein